MAQFPAFPLWTDAYLGDTTHLTTIEHGAYVLLLIAMWRSGKASLPADDRRLARLAKLEIRQWMRIKPTIMEFFDVDGNLITQGRLSDEWGYCRTRSKKQSDKARARWLVINGSDDATALPQHSRGYAPTPTPTPTKKDSRSSPNGDDHAFAEFWSAYPKKKAKRTAEKAYRSATKLTSHEKIMEGLASAKKTDNRFREIRFTPYPASWLNGGCWADEQDKSKDPYDEDWRDSLR